jgi:hypothetical protein
MLLYYLTTIVSLLMVFVHYRTRQIHYIISIASFFPLAATSRMILGQAFLN